MTTNGVAVALGEIKSGKRIRTAEKVESEEPPSKIGGKVAAQVFSDEGDDNVQGGARNDQVSGDGGVNTLTGGPGRDACKCDIYS